jgi:glycosyltransferase involved in cell wall biosynthesis
LSNEPVTIALMQNSPKPRLLVFVVTYEAESTVADVLSRIPPDLKGSFDVSVLVIDDNSNDRSFEIGLRSGLTSRFPTAVLYDPSRQGYGGNQKLGYTYAIRHSFDFLVLLRGDGQHAPESIPDLLQPLLDGEADTVLGSRVLSRGAPRHEGKPFRATVGSKILTWAQNRLLRVGLSEFHSGFRAYRVATLSQLPFQYCSDGFRFDIEIIVQLSFAGARITEIPIPPLGGRQSFRVNKFRYAKDLVSTALHSRLHRVNLLYARRFDLEGLANHHYELKLGFRSSHTLAIDAVPAGSRVLDIGSGPGHVAGELVKKDCTVDGADQWPASEDAPFQSFHIWREPGTLDIDVQAYDWVLLLDVVEHLRHPEQLLASLREAAQGRERTPRFIVTTGNVAFCIVRIQALLGSFNYGKRGILDMTHTRLYTFKTLRALFEESGFRIERMEGIPAPVPLALGNRWLAHFLVDLNSILLRILPGFFAYQIFMIVSPMPTVDALLDSSLRASQRRSAALGVTLGDEAHARAYPESAGESA